MQGGLEIPCHDRYAIAVMKRLPGRLVASVVGHLT